MFLSSLRGESMSLDVLKNFFWIALLIKYVNNGKIISMNNVALDDEFMKIERETVKKNPRIAEIERIKNFSNLSNKFCILKN